MQLRTNARTPILAKDPD
uniref:Uncharacterized protein n=1 Tax=Arundo donax TaxID=35708 RepID=A0A0A9AM84_ARUDO